MSAVEEDLNAAGEAAGKKSPSPLRAGTERMAPAVSPVGESKGIATFEGPVSFSGRMVRRLLTAIGNPQVEFVLWSGERVAPPGVDPVVKIHIKDRSTLYGLLRNPFVQFGDGYSDGRIDIEGDVVKLCEVAYQGSMAVGGSKSPLHRFVQWLQKPRANTLDGSKQNIHAHYDIGNPFYSLWLGKTMAYTCAYYPTENATLDEAQISKMHHVSRKLRLRPGDTVVEAGFGWGGLALHMAKYYGVKVRAFNISHEQVVYARERAKKEGLDSSIEYIEDDYRNITGKYDAFVSVGMLEHVGAENYAHLGAIARRSLGANGRGLIHSIGRNRPQPLHPWIEKRIFPGAYPPALSEFAQIFEPNGLSILDVENIRLHYAKTCRHWLELYEASTDKVKAMFDEKFVRMWRLYLAGSVAGFTTGTLQLFQVVFTTRENNDIPLTREYMYST
jgi:cyclopropane-fatty-acyl-phospholipid synthase